MRQNGRWHLTDFQRLLVVATVAIAVFVAAMSLGLGSIVLLGVAILLLIVASLMVFLLGLRYTGRELAEGEARVLSVPPPPPGQIVSRCDLRLQVHLPGQPVTVMRHRDASVPLTKWPREGQVLPVDLNPRTRTLRVRWDRVDPHRVEPSVAPAPIAAAAIPFFIDYADGPLGASTRPTDTPTGSGVWPPGWNVPQTAIVLHDQLLDPEARTSQPPELTPDLGTGSEPSGTEPGSGTRPPLRAEPPQSPPAPRRNPRIIPEPEPEAPTEPDVADGELTVSFEPEPTVQVEPPDADLPTRSIPQPRVAEQPPSAGPADAAGAMGIMLVVSDLTRSIRFYHELVGMTVVDQAANTAVLAYGGGRVVLRQLADMSPVDRRVSHLHIKVADVEAAYRDLASRGVQFVHLPRLITVGERLDLWQATFRDPDGHDIALTQWRDKDPGGH